MSSENDWALADFQAIDARLTDATFLAALAAQEAGFGGMHPARTPIPSLSDPWLARWRILYTEKRELLDGPPIRMGTVTVQLLARDFDDSRFLRVDKIVTEQLQLSTSSLHLRRSTSSGATAAEDVADAQAWNITFDMIASN